MSVTNPLKISLAIGLIGLVGSVFALSSQCPSTDSLKVDATGHHWTATTNAGTWHSIGFAPASQKGFMSAVMGANSQGAHANGGSFAYVICNYDGDDTTPMLAMQSPQGNYNYDGNANWSADPSHPDMPGCGGPGSGKTIQDCAFNS